MNDYNEYYFFLNISSDCTQTEIETAYRNILHEAKWHGGIMLNLVQEGYRCLSNPTLRAQYHAGTFPHETRVKTLRELNECTGIASEINALPRAEKIQFYQEMFDKEDDGSEATVRFEMLPNGKWRNTITGEIVDNI
jgi:DnaJ-class molecular chaperone